MYGLRNLLLREQIQLETIISKINNRMSKAPEGRLRLSKSHNYVQYYCCKGEDETGDYIPKNQVILAKELAQKSYDKKILLLAERRLSQINKIVKEYMDDELEQVYFKEHIERQKLIVPVVPTREQRVNAWKAQEYKGKDFQDDVPLILTEKGERVRSKSEKIMADFFIRKGIEYKYECPLHLKGFGMVYPDFTFLSTRTGEEIYWEHNGKVDDPAYARKMVKKINAYENNNIYVGERLILTYETEQTVLNTGKIEELVNRYLL